MERMISIRRAIQNVNASSKISINGRERSIADWLVWRRDVAPGAQNFLRALNQSVQDARNEAKRRGLGVQKGEGQVEMPTDIVLYINEKKLNKDIEDLEVTLGDLDGKLSLKNATLTIDVG